MLHNRYEKYFANLDFFANEDGLYFDYGNADGQTDVQQHFLDNLDQYLSVLTKRQSEVIRLLLLGKELPEIASIMGITRQAVNKHFWSAVEKMRQEIKINLS